MGRDDDTVGLLRELVGAAPETPLVIDAEVCGDLLGRLESTLASAANELVRSHTSNGTDPL